MILDVFIMGKPTVGGMINGMIAGLVGITPAAGYVDGYGAFAAPAAAAGPCCDVAGGTRGHRARLKADSNTTQTVSSQVQGVGAAGRPHPSGALGPPNQTIPRRILAEPG